MFSWGTDAGGRLGHGDGCAQSVPKKLELPSQLHEESSGGGVGDARVVEVAAGREHTLLLLEGGVILGCGKNGDSQLGLRSWDTRTVVPRPERVFAP